MTSVVIAYRNDIFLKNTIEGLLKGQDSTRFEIIVVDDFSDEPLTLDYPNVRIVRNQPQRGVGFSFDKGVSVAQGENIVLIGSDVIVKNSNWLDIVEDYCEKYPKSMGCSVCLSLDPYHLDVNNPADDVKRYGARVLPLSVTEDLPSDSPLLNQEYYVGMFDAAWLKREPKEDIAEIPCIYGALYAMRKDWYQHVGGWDSDFSRKLSGHAAWGSLEPWLSIKNYLFGGTCHMIKQLESGHIFHKFSNSESPNGRTDLFFYNKLFIAKCCMSDSDGDRLAKKVYDLRVQYELFTYPFNLGKKLLRDNMDYVLQVKERNSKGFVRDFDWYCRRFGITKNW